MVRELRRTKLNDLHAGDIDRIFRAAEQGGVTAAERKILERRFDRYASGWSSEEKQAWQSKLASATAPTDVPAPTSGPEAEDLSSRTKTVWMPGMGDSVQDAYIVDMTKLAVDLGFHLILDRPAWASMAGIAVGLSDATGLNISELDRIVDIVPGDIYASVWGEDNKIMTNGNDTTKPVKVLVPPDVSETTLNKAENFTADEGYHPYEYGFQGAVTLRAEDDAAINTAHSPITPLTTIVISIVVWMPNERIRINPAASDPMILPKLLYRYKRPTPCEIRRGSRVYKDTLTGKSAPKQNAGISIRAPHTKNRMSDSRP